MQAHCSKATRERSASPLQHSHSSPRLSRSISWRSVAATVPRLPQRKRTNAASAVAVGSFEHADNGSAGCRCKRPAADHASTAAWAERGSARPASPETSAALSRSARSETPRDASEATDESYAAALGGTPTAEGAAGLFSEATPSRSWIET